jgi:hypothetical protein
MAELELKCKSCGGELETVTQMATRCVRCGDLAITVTLEQGLRTGGPSRRRADIIDEIRRRIALYRRDYEDVRGTWDRAKLLELEDLWHWIGEDRQGTVVDDG